MKKIHWLLDLFMKSADIEHEIVPLGPHVDCAALERKLEEAEPKVLGALR